MLKLKAFMVVCKGTTCSSRYFFFVCVSDSGLSTRRRRIQCVGCSLQCSWPALGINDMITSIHKSVLLFYRSRNLWREIHSQGFFFFSLPFPFVIERQSVFFFFRVGGGDGRTLLSCIEIHDIWQ